MDAKFKLKTRLEKNIFPIFWAVPAASKFEKSAIESKFILSQVIKKTRIFTQDGTELTAFMSSSSALFAAGMERSCLLLWALIFVCWQVSGWNGVASFNELFQFGL